MRRRANLRLWVLGAALLGVGGCQLQQLAPASELTDEPQMITIRADPPAARAGDVVSLDALVHWPGDDWEAHWLVCIPSGDVGLSTCAGDSFPDDGQVPDCLLAPDAPLCRAPAGRQSQVFVPSGLELPADTSFPVFVELLAARTGVGWDGCWRAVADGVPTADCLLGLKTVWITSDATPNENPEPVELLVDEVTHDGSAPMVVGADASDLDEVTVDLGLLVDATSIDELVQREDPGDEVSLSVSWFTTCGNVEPRSGDRFSDAPSPGKVNCTPPADDVGPPSCEPAQAKWKPRTPGRCVVYAVVRDGLGGIGYLSREFEVRGAAVPPEDRTLQACNCRTDPRELPLPIPLLVILFLVLRRTTPRAAGRSPRPGPGCRRS